MRLKSCLAALALITSVAIMASQAEAVNFYSIDVISDQLVTVNSSTGNVSVVGSLGINTNWARLAWSGQKLFMLDIITGAPMLRELNTATGAVISSVAINAPVTNTGAVAEGFTSRNGQLILSFKNVAVSGTRSNAIGVLGLDGNISNITQFAAIEDIDFLASNSAGNILGGGDQYSGTGTTYKHYDLNSALSTSMGSFGSNTLGQVGFGPSDNLFGIDYGTKLIYSFGSDQTLATFTSQSYDNQMSLWGLAVVPEPTSLFLLGLGLTCAGVLRARQRARR